MTPQDLLKPRYKVIADYPNSINRLGMVIDSSEQHEGNPFSRLMSDTDGNPDKYPHLFKKLAWHEDRKPEEMPGYVKHERSGEVFKIVSIDWKYLSVYLHDDEFPRSFVNFIPATEEEYNKQKQKL